MTDTCKYVSEVEAAHAGTSVPKTACILLGYGADKEGYQNSERFMANIADAVAVAELAWYTARRESAWYTLSVN